MAQGGHRVGALLPLHRVTLSERAAKGLKLVSGLLLVGFGVLLVLAPELLR
jgi:hypothetical protein